MSGKVTRTVAERFAARVLKTSGCWLWTGKTGSGGYGRLVVNGKPVGAHRVSYELHIGPIPPALQLDHLCRVRSCVNPAHLEPVPQRTNLARGVGTAAIALRTGYCKHGHEFTPENTYERPTGGRSCRACVRRRSLEYTARQLARSAA